MNRRFRKELRWVTVLITMVLGITLVSAAQARPSPTLKPLSAAGKKARTTREPAAQQAYCDDASVKPYAESGKKQPVSITDARSLAARYQELLRWSRSSLGGDAFGCLEKSGEAQRACYQAAADGVCFDKQGKLRASFRPPGEASTAASAAGANWQAAFVQGLAQFLEKRAQQEVVLWLEDEILSQLCKGAPAKEGELALDIPAMFESTCALWKADKDHLGATFAAAVRTDLEALPVRLVMEAFNVDSKLALVLVTRFEEVRRGKPPLELIAGLYDDTTLINKCTTAPPAPSHDPKADARAARTREISCALRAVGAVVRWTGDAAEPKVSNPDVLDDAARSLIAVLLDECKELGASCQLRPLDEEKHLPQARALIQRVADVYSLAESWRRTAPATTAEMAARGGQLLERLIDIVEATLPLLKDDSRLGELWNDYALKSALRATAAALQGQMAEAVRDALRAASDAADHASPKVKLPEGLVKSLVLSADLASAKDAAGVQAAFEAAASPLGSWRQKHKHFTFSLNGYVGGSVGAEVPLLALKTSRPDLATNAAFGATGAIGLDLTWPYGNGWAGGFFLSVLDVGQLLNIPIAPGKGKSEGDNKAKTAEVGGELKIVQVLAPGLYAHTSFGDSPFTLGAGVSFAPLLRTYSEEGKNKDAFSMLRASVFLAVDISILPIYTSRSDTR